jgi:hypothetical protein
MRSFSGILFFIFFILLSSAVMLNGEEEVSAGGSISGVVLNVTEGNRPLPQWNVHLDTYVGTALSGLQSADTDKNGQYAFSELEIGPDRVYVVKVGYKGVEYLSIPLVLDESAPEQNINMGVYEGTDDSSQLSVDSHHIFIGPNGNGFRIQEVLMVRNNSHYTYMGTEGVTLQLSLPEGASNIEIGAGMDADIVQAEGPTVQLFEPITPLGQQIMYLYDLTLRGSSYSLSKKSDYFTQKLDVFLTVPGATISSEQLESREPLLIEGTQYLHLSGADLAPGTKILMLIADVPREAADITRVGLVSMAAFVIMVALIYAFTRRRKIALELAGRTERLASERDTLLDEIASLDDEHSRGNIPQQEYESIRKEKKRKLLSITSKLRYRR